MSELVCPGCGYRGKMGTDHWTEVADCPVCDGTFLLSHCTQERYDAVTAELERRTLHTRRLERVACPMTDEDRVAELLKRYEKSEMDRLIAFYRLQPIEDAYRRATREMEAAQQATEAVVAELREVGAEDALMAFNDDPIRKGIMGHRYRYQYGKVS